jgi:glycosyltransferase involved in cell wall biosynthesis
MTDAGSAADGRALVIVPTYNESESVAETVRRLFDAATDGVDLLVVDDGSPDGTADIVRDLASRDERIHLLERPSKAGLGTAYVMGFEWARERDYDAVVEMDADLSHDPADVPRLLAALGDADLVIGSRYIPGGQVENWGPFRKKLSAAGNWYSRLMLGFPVRDSTSGFRAFRVETVGEEALRGVSSHGYAFQIEMTRRVFDRSGRILEIPITFVERYAGQSKMNKRIVGEAIWTVTMWGLADLVHGKRKK